MRVKIPNPSTSMKSLLNALTDSFALSEAVVWEEGHEGDDGEGPFIVITITGQHQDRARRVFRNWNWCEIID